MLFFSTAKIGIFGEKCQKTIGRDVCAEECAAIGRVFLHRDIFGVLDRAVMCHA